MVLQVYSVLPQTSFVPHCVLLQAEVGKKGKRDGVMLADGMSPWLQEHLSFTGSDSLPVPL